MIRKLKLRLMQSVAGRQATRSHWLQTKLGRKRGCGRVGRRLGVGWVGLCPTQHGLNVKGKDIYSK